MTTDDRWRGDSAKEGAGTDILGYCCRREYSIIQNPLLIPPPPPKIPSVRFKANGVFRYLDPKKCHLFLLQARYIAQREEKGTELSFSAYTKPSEEVTKAEEKTIGASAEEDGKDEIENDWTVV